MLNPISVRQEQLYQWGEFLPEASLSNEIVRIFGFKSKVNEKVVLKVH